MKATTATRRTITKWQESGHLVGDGHLATIEAILGAAEGLDAAKAAGVPFNISRAAKTLSDLLMAYQPPVAAAVEDPFEKMIGGMRGATVGDGEE